MRLWTIILLLAAVSWIIMRSDNLLLPAPDTSAGRGPALEELLLAAEAEDAKAQTELANRYYRGEDGEAPDYREAFYWFRLAADQGDARAQYGLGQMYSKGLFVGTDLVEAARFFHLSAEKGFVSAQITLGYIYGEGEGVPHDLEEAMRWSRMAADQGSPIGQNNLAWELYRMERPDEALDHVERSLAERPNEVYSIDTRAHVLAALGRTDEALADFEQAMNLGKVDQVRLYRRALIKHGYRIGEFDGVYDEDMRAALADCLKRECRLLE